MPRVDHIIAPKVTRWASADRAAIFERRFHAGSKDAQL